MKEFKREVPEDGTTPFFIDWANPLEDVHTIADEEKFLGRHLPSALCQGILAEADGSGQIRP